MAMVNIPSTCDDPSYRYKMPRLVSKKEGRGNGSKTCIVNMSDVARALRRPPQYTTKWFGSELGAQSTFTNKEGEGERAIVNGHHDTPVFQTMLDKFIDTYVLCQNCKLPEIDMAVKKGLITAKCAACGWAGELDNNHKLAAFITKNPPDETGHNVVNLAVADAKGQKSKDERRKEREEKRKKKAEGEDDDEDDDDEKPKKEKKERSGEKKEKKERSGEKKEKKERTPEEEEERKARKEARAEKKASGEKKEKKSSGEKKEKKSKKPEEPAAKDDDSDSGDDKEEDNDAGFGSEIVMAVIGIMKEFVANSSGKVKPEDFFEELRMQQLAKLFDHKIRFLVALESLMPSGGMDAKSIAEHKPVLACVLGKVKIPESDILWGFDAYLAGNDKSVKSYPMVLKVIYDEDWASEKEILKHYVEQEDSEEPGFAAAQKAGAPFFKWLQTADESDDDEDESGSEES